MFGVVELDFDRDVMERMGREVSARIAAHLASLSEMPACGDVEAAADCRAMDGRIPERGRPLEEILDRLFEDWIPRSFLTPGPGYLAYVPGGGLYPAALADFISSAVNRYTGVWRPAPMLVQLEAHVLDWLRDWMGFPEGTRGLLTSGGSLSNLSALVTAREEKLGPDIRKGTIYVSDQTHHCVAKAAKLAGVAGDRVRRIPSDEDFRMRVDELARAVVSDREAGLRPFLVVSSAGTTNTGAVDPLPEIQEFAGREGLWHHCDGAYGAFFHMVPGLKNLLEGLSEVDSLTLDPHKGLFLPYGTGALLVRDGEALRRTHAATADYLPDLPEEDLYDPSLFGPELSRPFRGLRIWLCVQLYGAERIRRTIAEKRELALYAAERIAAMDGLELQGPPQLSILAFRVSLPGGSPEEEDAATKELVRRVNEKNRVHISGCVARGRFLARLCILCHRTHRRNVDEALADLEASLP